MTCAAGYSRGAAFGLCTGECLSKGIVSKFSGVEYKLAEMGDKYKFDRVSWEICNTLKVVYSMIIIK